MRQHGVSRVIFHERRSLLGGQSVMEITFREIRKFGEALIILDQHPSLISLPAMGNTYTTICFNLKHKKDIGAMGQCMILDEAGKELLGKLEVGEAVIKLQGRVANPFLLAVPEFNINKGTITDDKIREVMEDKVFIAADYSVTKTESIPTLVELFLIDIRDHPESGVAARYKRLDTSVRQGQKIKYELLKAGLLTEEEIHNSIGRIIRLSLTQKGLEKIGNTE